MRCACKDEVGICDSVNAVEYLHLLVLEITGGMLSDC